jgi:hypothetical protein
VAVLGDDADVAQLLNVSHLGQPAHHALPPHPLQSAEVDVPEPIMLLQASSPRRAVRQTDLATSSRITYSMFPLRGTLASSRLS